MLRTAARRLLPALALVLLATGCSGGTAAESAPTDASVEDFCAAIAGTESDAGDTFADAQARGEQLVEVGTPSDMPDEARAGYELVVDALLEAETEGDLLEVLESAGSEDQDAAAALADYLLGVCPDALGLAG